MSRIDRGVLIFTGLPVAPGNRATWDAQLLKIPAVSPSIINCCVIKVEYYVKVGHVYFGYKRHIAKYHTS